MKSQKASPWLWMCLSWLTLAYLVWAIGPLIYCHYAGNEAIAVVTNRATKEEGGFGDAPIERVYYFTLTFDGHNVQKRTSGKHEIGDRLPVIYLEGNPDIVVRGSRADGLWHTIVLSTNERNVIIVAGVAAFFLLCFFKSYADEKKDKQLAEANLKI